ncbi:site-2 protease family protein [Candidatus Woesebacteria bacterium]|nr:site-2 protease family protein [Candidatus Woesebacteria bacterium]
MFTVIVFFLVLSLLVIIHELGHFVVAKWNGIKVEEFGFGIPPRLFGIRIGETLYSLNWLPFGGFVKVYGEELADVKDSEISAADRKRSFAHKKPWQKLAVLVAGVTLNFILGWAIVSYLFTKGVPVPSENVVVQAVSEKSPAADAGLQKGDMILNASGTDDTDVVVKESGDVSKLAQKNAGKTLLLTIKRGDKEFETPIIPRVNPPKGQGALGVVISNYTIKKYSYIEAPVYGLVESAKITGIIAQELGKTLVRFVTFQKQEAEIAGPVGIAQLTSQAAKQGIDPLLQLIGLLSLNLAVLNILPFPALDGGRVVFVLYEWITRKKVNAKFEQRLNFAGFALLISLLILVTINDIVKLFK